NAETLPIPPTNRIPLQFLWPYDKVQVGHFEMEALKVRGKNGLFSGLGSMYNPQWGITFKVYFKNIAINELYQLTDGTVHVETIGAQAYIDSFEDGLDDPDSIPIDDEPIDTDTDINIPQDTITVDGIIDSVFVDATTGDIVVVTEDGGEIVIDEEDLESEDGSVLLTDSAGNSWVVDGDGNVSKNTEELSEVVTDGSKKDSYLKFIIDDVDYQNGDSYYTMYTKKNLKITVEQTDTIKRDLSGIKWELEGEEIASMKNEPTQLQFKVKKGNLPKSTNNLVVYDSNDKVISKLKIQTYQGPEIVFNEKQHYNGEYLFDEGFNFSTLVGDYETINIGSKNKTYYAPVLGIVNGNNATIRINVKQLKAAANKDPNFKLIIKPEIEDIISIDNSDSLVLDANTLNSTKSIIIKALKSINGTTLSSMKIYAYLLSTGEKVGMMEYYCADRIKKTVNLIYVQFSNENEEPESLDTSVGTFETYLEDQSMNQLFLDFDVNSYHHQSRFNTEDLKGISQEQILDSLNVEYFGNIDPPAKYGTELDYFYVTNLDIKKTESTYLAAFHWVNAPGGVQVKFRSSTSGESRHGAATHEFGHWLGLPHTFEIGKGKYTSKKLVDGTQGATSDNFMDYKVQRKKWFKFQLLNYVR
ncbi:MAG: hypothetical protein L3J06_04190, partial [Cyclobacteriaceae bacterium]|nr:hypothetical protein [Cyclobacteriaceae bacterium]